MPFPVKIVAKTRTYDNLVSNDMPVKTFIELRTEIKTKGCKNLEKLEYLAQIVQIFVSDFPRPDLWRSLVLPLKEPGQ